jgi:hypothetical protein
VDTAGLRDSDDVIEVEGLRRARMEMSRADFVLYVVDATRGYGPGEVAQLPTGTATLIVWNKVDLPEAQALPPAEDRPAIAVSALLGAGLPELREQLKAAAGYQSDSSAWSARRRHVDALARAQSLFELAEARLSERAPLSWSRRSCARRTRRSARSRARSRTTRSSARCSPRSVSEVMRRPRRPSSRGGDRRVCRESAFRQSDAGPPRDRSSRKYAAGWQGGIDHLPTTLDGVACTSPESATTAWRSWDVARQTFERRVAVLRSRRESRPGGRPTPCTSRSVTAFLGFHAADMSKIARRKAWRRCRQRPCGRYAARSTWDFGGGASPF